MGNHKNQVCKENEDQEKARLGIESAIKEISGIKLMLDTNILIAACDGTSSQKKVIAEIAGQNATHICDTVFWEFLRNCSLEKFRERFGFLTSNNLLEVEHEDGNVQRMYQAVWATYLCCFQDDPRQMAAIAIPDLWIVATTVQRGIENILTSDNSDFPDKLFDKKKYFIGKEKTIILMTFNRERAKSYLKEALDKGLLVSFLSFRN